VNLDPLFCRRREAFPSHFTSGSSNYSICFSVACDHLYVSGDGNLSLLTNQVVQLRQRIEDESLPEIFSLFSDIFSQVLHHSWPTICLIT